MPRSVIPGRYRGGMDPAGSCGTIRRPMLAPRWFCVLAVAVLIALGATRAQAQVFRPRTGKGAVVASKAPAVQATATGASTASTAKKTGPVAATPTAGAAKKPARGTAARKTGKKHGKKRGDSDAVVIDDDEDEDVKITDD